MAILVIGVIGDSYVQATKAKTRCGEPERVCDSSEAVPQANQNKTRGEQCAVLPGLVLTEQS